MSDRSLNSPREETLLQSIMAQQCVLFLGPGAAVCPSGRTIDEELLELVRPMVASKTVGLPDGLSLPHLCQLAGQDLLKDIRETVKLHLTSLKLKGVTSPAHGCFARMEFRWIVQLTPDPFMANAIGDGNCECDYYNFQQAPVPTPSKAGVDAGRLVYGLRGLWSNVHSIPFSTDEEVRHLVALLREQPKLPEALTAVLRGSGSPRSALFVGFDFAAWQTRMLLHGLFAIAPSTIVTPEPSVATLPDIVPAARLPRRPSDEDLEFLWATYRLFTTAEAPPVFAARLEQRWRSLTTAAGDAAALPKPNRRELRKFLAEIFPDDKLSDVAWNQTEYWHENKGRWPQLGRSEKARELIDWADGRHSLATLIESARTEMPDLFEQHREALFKRSA